MSESDILKSCLNRLDWWQRLGIVIHFDRHNAGLICVNGRWIRMAKSGTPDIIAYIKYNGICAICFFECKSETGKQSENQIKFMMKFKDLTNVWYDIIRHPQSIDARIETITGYSDNQFASMPKEL